MWVLLAGSLNELSDTQEAQGKLKENESLTAEKEEQFEKEITIAQKLASLHKSHCDKRTAEAVQLESIVRDLRRHVEVFKAALSYFKSECGSKKDQSMRMRE